MMTCLELERFKECARHVWNSAFLDLLKLNPNIAFQFDKVESELFDALVVQALGIEWPGGRYRYSPVPGLFVQLHDLYGSLNIMTCSEAKLGESKKWEATTVIPAAHGPLEFISFFQWDTFSFADWPYVECLDVRNARLMLVDRDKCKIYLDASKLKAATA
jgi:hypothetical protein